MVIEHWFVFDTVWPLALHRCSSTENVSVWPSHPISFMKTLAAR